MADSSSSLLNKLKSGSIGKGKEESRKAKLESLNNKVAGSLDLEKLLFSRDSHFSVTDVSNNRPSPFVQSTDFKISLESLKKPGSSDSVADWLRALCNKYNIKISGSSKDLTATANVISPILPGKHASDDVAGEKLTSADFHAKLEYTGNYKQRYLFATISTLADDHGNHLSGDAHMIMNRHSPYKIQGKLPTQLKSEFTNFKATEVYNQDAIDISELDRDLFKELQLNGAIVIAIPVTFQPREEIRGDYPKGPRYMGESSRESNPNAYSTVGAGSSDINHYGTKCEDGTYHIDFKAAKLYLIQPTIVSVKQLGSDLANIADKILEIAKSKVRDSKEILFNKYGLYDYDSLDKMISNLIAPYAGINCHHSDLFEHALLKAAGIEISPIASFSQVADKPELVRVSLLIFCNDLKDELVAKFKSLYDCRYKYDGRKLEFYVDIKSIMQQKAAIKSAFAQILSNKEAIQAYRVASARSVVSYRLVLASAAEILSKHGLSTQGDGYEATILRVFGYNGELSQADFCSRFEEDYNNYVNRAFYVKFYVNIPEHELRSVIANINAKYPNAAKFVSAADSFAGKPKTFSSMLIAKTILLSKDFKTLLSSYLQTNPEFVKDFGGGELQTTSSNNSSYKFIERLTAKIDALVSKCKREISYYIRDINRLISSISPDMPLLAEDSNTIDPVWRTDVFELSMHAGERGLNLVMQIENLQGLFDKLNKLTELREEVLSSPVLVLIQDAVKRGDYKNSRFYFTQLKSEIIAQDNQFLLRFIKTTLKPMLKADVNTAAKNSGMKPAWN